MSVGGDQDLSARCRDCDGTFEYAPSQPPTNDTPEHCVFCGSQNVTFRP